MDIGRIGIWTAQLDLQPAARARDAAAELDELGYGALWVPEAVGREALTHAAVLLGATRRLVVATGIASVFSRTAMATANAQRLLADASGGRFLLGLGVSHAPMVEGLLGQTWDRPIDRMRSYLDGIDGAFTVSPAPADDPPRVLAALGPAMLRLAAERSWGALTYFVPVEHTPFAREHLGSGPRLVVEQAAVLSDDPDAARRAARKHMEMYLTLPNYVNNLRRLGWGDADLAGGGSDALVDALVAWGDVGAVADRVAAHHAAGADHVCVQVLDQDVTALPLDEWRALAAALLPPKRKGESKKSKKKAKTKATRRPA
jgi:probable F420-dependent oxidoreductase